MDDTSFPPTSAEIVKLPPNLRRWIHELETDADPSCRIRDAVVNRQNAEALSISLKELQKEVAEIDRLTGANMRLEKEVKNLKGELDIAWSDEHDPLKEELEKARAYLKQSAIDNLSLLRQVRETQDLLKRCERHVRHETAYDGKLDEELEAYLARLCK